LLEHFADLPDPRAKPAKRHPLLNVLFIAICALLSGAEDFVAMEEFGHAKYDWLAQRLDLSSGIPSHDTFGRVFAALDPDAFARCFVSWVAAIRTQVNAEIVPLDGKTLRHSFDSATGKAAIHMVSAWAAKNRLVLGQVKVDDKSNEITAIPVLLRMLELSGCIVTCDAMGCQKAIATQIKQQKGEYLLALKDNHSGLSQDVQALFEHAELTRWENCAHDQYQQSDYAHARLETRCCTAVALVGLGDLWQDVQQQWSGLSSLVRIQSTRRLAGKLSTKTRYYLSSLPADARRLLRVARAHWSIENCLHWVLDVAFDEDACRVRKEHAPQNLATLRHLALNLLGQEKSVKGGVKNRRLRAGWDSQYLEKLLTG
jgi:predicted transposase YbfD/YdcC